MKDDYFTEAQAASMLPGRPHERTLRRWRQAGKVPFCKTPGGRIRYTFAQLAEIGAGMIVEPIGAREALASVGRQCPDLSGELQEAAE